MSEKKQQGSGREHRERALQQQQEQPENRVDVRPIVEPGLTSAESTTSVLAPPKPAEPARPRPVLRVFRRRGVGDVYELGGVAYRLEKTVGSDTGQAVGKSEVWRAREVGSDREVFLKKFSSPLYPSDEDLLDPVLGAEYKRRYQRFEDRHVEVGNRLKRDLIGSGALVKPLAFGRPKESLACIKVYPWVADASVLSRDLVKDWSTQTRTLFLRTLLLGLWELHALGVVHGDIKKENILVVEQPIGPVARLIDFDEAFPTDAPPMSLDDYEVGTTYFTPEWKMLEDSLRVQQMTGLRPEELRLGSATDIFQLAIVLEEVFGTGSINWMQKFGGELDDNAEASLQFATPATSDLGLSRPRVAQLLRQSLLVTPTRRPGVPELLSAIGVSVV
jgi:serine/threonine protein kinase